MFILFDITLGDSLKHVEMETVLSVLMLHVWGEKETTGIG